MRKILLSYTLAAILLVTLGFSGMEVSAAGWGYKKTMDNKLPDVGEYAEMLEGHEAVFHGDTSQKKIYFTFDNGYEKGYTEKVLDVLEKHEVPATFFVTGHYVKDQPKLIKRMVNDGHIIGNHSYHHPDFTKISKEKMKQELEKLEQSVAEITTQKTTQYLRPPSGTFNEKSLEWSDELGYVQVFWSLAFKDWETNKQHGADYAYEQVMKQVHPGAIILMHTVSSDNSDALDKILTDLKKEGYSFGSLDEVILQENLPADLQLFF